MAETDVVMVATPDDGSCGIGAYAGHLRNHLQVPVEHVELRTNSVNPLHFAATALTAGTADADIVHVQHEYGLFGRMTLLWWVFAPVLWITTQLRAVPVVFTLHEAWTEETAGETAKWLQHWYIRMVNTSIAVVADYLLFLSASRESAYLSATPVTVPGFRRIPHGVNVVDAVDVSPAEAKEQFGYEVDDTVLVEPGYVSRQKGADVFVDLASRIPEHEFLLAGGARNPSDDSFVRQLTDRAPSNVQVTGVLPDESFHTAFQAADLVVLPYRKDGQSGVFNLCSAYELPVVASNCDYFQRMAEEWDCAALFEVDEPADAETAVRRLLRDENERANLSEAMRSFREANRFDLVADRHRDLYRDVVD